MAVGGANGYCQRVSCVIRLGDLIQTEKQLHHLLYLEFAGPAVGGYCLLDLERGELHHRHPVLPGCHYCHASGLSHYQCGLDVLAEKKLFHCHQARLVLFDKRIQLVIDLAQPLGEIFAGPGLDRSVSQCLHSVVIGQMDNTVASISNPWVNSQDNFVLSWLCHWITIINNSKNNH